MATFGWFGYFITAVLVLFLIINFNQELGVIYSVMTAWWLIFDYLALDKHLFNPLPVEKNKNDRYMSLVVAGGAYVAFTIITFYVYSYFVGIPDGQNMFEFVAKQMATTFSATPILYGSKYLRLIVWGILIPVVETSFFFGTLPQWGAKYMNKPLPDYIWSISAFTVAAFYAALFTIFHAVAKGIGNNKDLIITFIFGFVSMMLVIYFKEKVQAIFLHVINNTYSTLVMLGLGFSAGFAMSSFVIIGVIMLVTWFLMFQEIPFVNSVRP